MKSKLLLLFLLAGGALAAETRVIIGFGVGGYYPPPPPPRVLAYRPACPGPGFVWINGYWYPDGGRYHWRAGYWVRPPHPHARWVAPRYRNHRYHPGYWRR
jgi:hypothetical protein